jgi:hypothetical protein
MEGKAGKVALGKGKLNGPDRLTPTYRTMVTSANIHNPSPLLLLLPYPLSPSLIYPILLARSRSSR